MANRLLRSFAVKIGAGLATALSLTSATRRPRRQTLHINPILSRIQDIENRVTRVELAPPPQAGLSGEEIEALETLVSSQSEDIAGLRESLLRIEHRNAGQAEVFGQKVALVEQQLPAFIEASVNARMAELEQRLRGEFQEVHNKTVDAFVSTIENRVVGRIEALEKSLAGQSQSIAALREKSLKTDDNLQRLLVAVEKLCARAEAQAQIPVVAPPPLPEARPAAEQTAHKAEAEPGPDLAFAGGGYHPPPARRAMKTVGVAILGLAFLGFRLLR